MGHHYFTGDSNYKQLGLISLKMENEKLKRAVKDYERRIEELRTICRRHSIVDMGDGTYANQLGRVPIYEIAGCFDPLPYSPLGNNELYQKARWIAHKE